MLFSWFIPTLIKGYLKSKYLKINYFFEMEGVMLLIKKITVESLLFIEAGAGAGEKKTQIRSKTDRLCNTGLNRFCG